MRREVTVYVDGACSGNPGAGGYAAIIECDGKRKELTGGYRLTTNSRMEIMAVIQALFALKMPCQVTVYSDSQYLVKAIEDGWLEKWQKNGWRKRDRQAVQNVDLWQRLIPLLKQHEVSFVWIAGHNGDAKNERCNDLAQKACREPNLPPDEGYLKRI
ncbi:MAG: Ribonuclease HI [Anaerolineae bacterium]|nr:MAG: Ribonuclease HI [Anaerolineae bacterium]